MTGRQAQAGLVDHAEQRNAIEVPPVGMGVEQLKQTAYALLTLARCSTRQCVDKLRSQRTITIKQHAPGQRSGRCARARSPVVQCDEAAKILHHAFGRAFNLRNRLRHHMSSTDAEQEATQDARYPYTPPANHTQRIKCRPSVTDKTRLLDHLRPLRHFVLHIGEKFSRR